MSVALEISELTSTGQWRVAALSAQDALAELAAAAERLGIVAARPYAAEVVKRAARRRRTSSRPPTSDPGA